ncbi:MAG: hypothetical protein ACRDNE_00675 [Gaiellaceae bacterium]
MATITTRPDVTVDLGGAEVTGAGGDADAALADDSDLSFLTIEPGDSPSIFGFGDALPPVGAVIKSVGVRGRAEKDGLHSATLGVVVTDAGEPTWSFGGSVVVTWRTPTTVTIASAERSTPVSSIRCELEHLSGPVDLAVFELYFDLVYVPKPVPDLLTPTGTVTADAIPLVTWANTLDADGGPQTHFRVAVMANGGHPDTHIPVADSGKVATAAAQWQMEEPLVNATYDLYLKTAQTVGVNQHWSDWAQEPDVVLDVPAPPVPTGLTLTPESNEGRVRIDFAEDVGGSVSSDGFHIQRSLDGGTTWADIRTVDGDGTVSHPTVVAVGEFSDTADGTTHNAVLPAPLGGIQADDLLIAVAGFDGNPTISWPSGWTEIKDEAGNGSAVRVGCAYKRATGGEIGTVAITTSVAEGGGGRILCIRHAHPTQPPAISAGANGSLANSADPDALNPAGWDVEDTLWIAAMGNDGDVAVTAGPVNYYDFGNARWANVAGAGVATAFRRNPAGAEDPGTFTHAAEDNRAFTVAVRPERALLRFYDWEAPNGRDVSYRVAAIHDFPVGTSSQSAWVTAVTQWSSTFWWLKHAADPDLNIEIPHGRVFSQPGHRRLARRGRFQPLGSDRIIEIRDKRGPPEGELVLELETEAQQAALDALLDSVSTVLVQAPPSHHWPDRWVGFGDQDHSRMVDKLEVEDSHETLPWAEVTAPSDNLVVWP